MAYTILQQVKIRLGQYTYDSETSDITFTKPDINPRLEQLIQQITDEVTAIRRYPSDYTEDQKAEDLSKFESNIVNLVVYDFKKVGGDFQESDTENGKSRSWVDRESLLARVYPLARSS